MTMLERPHFISKYEAEMYQNRVFWFAVKALAGIGLLSLILVLSILHFIFYFWGTR